MGGAALPASISAHLQRGRDAMAASELYIDTPAQASQVSASMVGTPPPLLLNSTMSAAAVDSTSLSAGVEAQCDVQLNVKVSWETGLRGGLEV